MGFPAASAGPNLATVRTIRHTGPSYRPVIPARHTGPSYRPVIPAKPVSTDRVRGQLNDGSRPAPGRRL